MMPAGKRPTRQAHRSIPIATLPGTSRHSVALNELMSDNQSSLEDPDEPGKSADWLELYNGGTEAVDLGGLHLTDSLTDPDQFRIQDGLVIPAGGFLVFYADGEPEQGILHTNFKLSASGETLGLYGADGRVLINSVQFPALEADINYERRPDGIGNWGIGGCATPGRENQTCRWQLFLPTCGPQCSPTFRYLSATSLGAIPRTLP